MKLGVGKAPLTVISGTEVVHYNEFHNKLDTREFEKADTAEFSISSTSVVNDKNKNKTSVINDKNNAWFIDQQLKHRRHLEQVKPISAK